MIRDGFAYTQREASQLIEMWKRTISSGECSAAVIEDLAGAGLMWCCFVGFISEDYRDSIYKSTQPYIGRRILADYMSGERPLLSLAEIASRNSTDGLNLIVINSGAAQWVQTPEILPVLATTLISFTAYHTSGYRLNEFILESYTSVGSQWAEGSGLRLRRDLSNNVMAAAIEAGQPEARLYALNRTEAIESSGTVTASVFQYKRPNFGFSATERETLVAALTDSTYGGQAELLNVAAVTVGKRWQSIFDKVLSSPNSTGLIPALVPKNQEIGDKKLHCKRIIIEYVRHHMEEVRPYTEPLIDRVLVQTDCSF